MALPHFDVVFNLTVEYTVFRLYISPPSVFNPLFIMPRPFHRKIGVIYVYQIQRSKLKSPFITIVICRWMPFLSV